MPDHEARFQEWLALNPHAWTLFERYAFDAIQSGRRHYSADAIVHRIRWQLDIEMRRTDDFKMNNNHVAFLARMFIKNHPDHARFFRLRAQKSKR